MFLVYRRSKRSTDVTSLKLITVGGLKTVRIVVDMHGQLVLQSRLLMAITDIKVVEQTAVNKHPKLFIVVRKPKIQ